MATPASSFRDFEHSGWQQSVSAYDKYFGPLTASTTDTLLEDIGQGMRVLDVATGPGYIAAEAHRRGATAIGVDFSDEMVTRAKALFANQSGVSYEVGDAEHLRFDIDEFDHVVMNFGALHLSNPDKAFAEAHRVLRPGGRYAFTVWAPPEEAQGFALMLKCIQAHGDPNVALPPGPPFFRFSDPAESERSLVAVGFRNVSVRKLPLKWSLGSAEELFEAFYAGTARTGGLLRAQSPTDLAKIRAEVSEASKPYEQSGSLEIPMPAVLVTARK